MALANFYNSDKNRSVLWNGQRYMYKDTHSFKFETAMYNGTDLIVVIMEFK